MRVFIKILVVTFLLIFVQSCNKIFKCKDDELTIPRTENNTNKLKLNGYYYCVCSFDTSSAEVYLLYQNGIFFNKGSVVLDDVINNKVIFSLGNEPPKNKPFWGIYRISNNDIEIEYWFPQSNGCVKVENQKGVILNDSTFKITSKKTKDTDEESVNNVFHFKQYSPKPDSTVSFIP